MSSLPVLLRSSRDARTLNIRRNLFFPASVGIIDFTKLYRVLRWLYSTCQSTPVSESIGFPGPSSHFQFRSASVAEKICQTGCFHGTVHSASSFSYWYSHSRFLLLDDPRPLFRFAFDLGALGNRGSGLPTRVRQARFLLYDPLSQVGFATIS